MRLLLIRHGASEHARRRMIADVRACPGLTPEGEDQARRLAARLAATNDPDDVRLTSPVARARDTAAILGTSFLPMPDLREILPGEAEGLSFADYADRLGAFDLVAEPNRLFAPDGESWAGFLARVRATLAGLAAAYEGRTVLAVSHAGFIMASMLVLLDIPRPGNTTWLDPDNTGITEWAFGKGQWRLIRFNDTAHLTVEFAR